MEAGQLRRLLLLLLLRRSRTASEHAAAMRTASMALGRWQADAVCGEAGPRKKVAVLISGLVRTLHRPHVHRSIAQYGIDAMGVDATVFLELKTNGTGRLGDERRGAAARAEAAAAVEYLRPASVRWDAPESELHAALRPCGPVPATSATTHWIVSQWLGVKGAFQQMVRHERATGARFDAVLKLRGDDLWLGPGPVWCALDALWAGTAAYANLVGSDRDDYVGGLDWWLAVPRRFAEDVFLLADAYLSCNKSNPQHSEKWLSQTLRNTRGLALRRLRHLPRVIVYEERLAAKKFCAYVPAYQEAACNRLRYPPQLD